MAVLQGSFVGLLLKYSFVGIGIYTCERSTVACNGSF